MFCQQMADVKVKINNSIFFYLEKIVLVITDERILILTIVYVYNEKEAF